tara:strand:+ start:87 stop:848 length:762 start_codon:yes stop_codon:yes gene_type:complete
MKVLGIIPARYGSSRLEGKPLKDIEGKSMIQRVYERCTIALDEVFIATDDKRIKEHVNSFGAKVVMTSKEHKTGTNRCLEAMEIIMNEEGLDPDVIINIQGDEPLLQPDQLKKLVACFEEDKNVDLASLAMPAGENAKLEEHNGCFVVLDENKDALYFSRSIIPYLRDFPKEEWAKNHQYLYHIGMYAYKPEALKLFANLPQNNLEISESLEQLRWLQAGKKIRIRLSTHETIAVDTQEDLEKVRAIVRKLES